MVSQTEQCLSELLTEKHPYTTNMQPDISHLSELDMTPYGLFVCIVMMHRDEWLMEGYSSRHASEMLPRSKQNCIKRLQFVIATARTFAIWP